MTETERKRLWRKNNPDKCRAARIKYRTNNREKLREQKLRHKLKSLYGITLEQLREKEFAQEFKCKICSIMHLQLVVDHCHETKKVRDLLCHTCNLLLGHSKENVAILESAIEYLKRHK